LDSPTNVVGVEDVTEWIERWAYCTILLFKCCSVLDGCDAIR
jgi:hypothetical protein